MTSLDDELQKELENAKEEVARTPLGRVEDKDAAAKAWLLNNFYTRLPQGIHQVIAEGEKAIDILLGECECTSAGWSAFYLSKTARAFLRDVSSAVKAEGIPGELVDVASHDKRCSADRIIRTIYLDEMYTAYVALRNQGYSKTDLTI